LATHTSSKTYAPGDTSALENAEARSCDLRVTLRSTSMRDVLMLALAFGFFAAAIGYTYACERL
jgi:hypothetical protein